jgi:hypothetical protein
MRRSLQNRWLTLATALVFHALVGAAWLAVASVAVAIAVGASPRSEQPSDAAFLTALALAGALWLAGIALIVARWRSGRSLLRVPILWTVAASAAGLIGLASSPDRSHLPPAPDAPVQASPALRALGKLAFAIPSAKGSTTDIYLMNADGTGLANLTRNEADDAAPAWSPNGVEIAFSSDGGEAHARDVYAITIANRTLRNLTNGAGANYDPAWSPDGQTIAFASERWDDDAGLYDEHYEIYLRRRDTVTKLTRNDTDDVGPVWSPGGAMIAFNRKRDGNWEIYVMNADGSGQRNLTSDPADDEDPAWSPDGKRIAFVSDRDGAAQVYVMNAGGDAVQRLTHVAGGKSRPVWSPDGRKIAFIGRGDHGLYLMNADGSGMRRLLGGVDEDGGLSWQPRAVPRSTPMPAVGPRATPGSSSAAGTLCKRPGARYVGSTLHGGKVCFTLTLDGRALREVGFSFVAEDNCRARARGTNSADFSASPISLEDRGHIALDNGSILFRAEIQGATASGVLADRQICGTRRVKWTADRGS